MIFILLKAKREKCQIISVKILTGCFRKIVRVMKAFFMMITSTIIKIQVDPQAPILHYSNELFFLDNSWISAKAIAFELNFEADFDTSENVTSENDTKCALNMHYKAAVSCLIILG